MNPNAMKRVMVIGCCGAGKSTFSKKLHEILGLEIIHLDQHYWKPNWVESDKEEWEQKVKSLVAKDEWIMDGNYGGTMEFRLERADTVVFLDYSTLQCLWRITKRIHRYKGQVRPDMTEACPERYDLEFYHYVATFNLMRRKSLYEKINKHQIQQFVLKNDQQVARFFEELEQAKIT